jgi:hypothetical protein
MFFDWRNGRPKRHDRVDLRCQLLLYSGGEYVDKGIEGGVLGMSFAQDEDKMQFRMSRLCYIVMRRLSVMTNARTLEDLWCNGRVLDAVTLHSSAG